MQPVAACARAITTTAVAMVVAAGAWPAAAPQPPRATAVGRPVLVAARRPPTTRLGDHGDRVRRLQRRLVQLRFDPGPVDGAYGRRTLMAVWAFQKTQGLRPDGVVGPRTRRVLAHPRRIGPASPSRRPNRIEIDKGRQLLLLWRNGRLRLVTHVSTGTGRRYCHRGHCERAVTPVGRYRVFRRIHGWRDAPLGLLYNPLYFNGGIAVHGARRVPSRPASHGCVRVPLHISQYLPGLVPPGMPVRVVARAHART
ncbi:hypothetical protein BH20ACT9_BH20ACT9_00880 [soil metagenome]